MTGRRGSPRARAGLPAENGEDWQTVARAINERMALRRIGQQELADLAGISVSTLRLVQHGANRRVRNKTLAAIARALGWPDDHLQNILTGRSDGDAVPAGADQPILVGLEILDGVREIRDELRRIAHRLDEMDHPGRTDPPR
jgi:DNA-binding Xre family transcriptional regulator